MKGWNVTGPNLSVAHKVVTAQIEVEIVGEDMTETELEAIVNEPSTRLKIAAAINKQVVRAFDRSRTVGWHEDGNRPVEIVGVTECLVTGPQAFVEYCDESGVPVGECVGCKDDGHPVEPPGNAELDLDTGSWRALAPNTPGHRWMKPVRMSCGHQLVQYAFLPDGAGGQRCPLCGADVVIERVAS